MEQTNTGKWATRGLLLASAGCTLLILGWLLWLMRFGLDFTDESFYLVWIADPFRYSVSLSQFGFIYHPLYRLVGGDIAMLRQVNFVITYLLAFTLVHLFLKKMLRPLPRWEGAVIAAAMAIGMLAFVRLWLPSPSYNWLAFQALMIAAIGLLCAEKHNNPDSNIGWVLISIGGWLAFMAKPSSAAALAVIAALYVLGAGKFNLRLALRSVLLTAFLLLLSAFAIDGSVGGFIDRLRGGMEVIELLGSGHTVQSLLRLDRFTFMASDQKLLFGGALLIAAAALLACAHHAALRALSMLLQIAAAIGTAYLVLGNRIALLVATDDYHLLLWMVPLAALLVALVLSRGRVLRRVTRAQWAMFAALLLMPYAFAIGTGNNYWWMGGLTGIFWLLAGLVFLAPTAVDRLLVPLLLPFGFAVQFFAVSIVIMGIQSPYYQTQLIYLHDTPAQIGGGELLLSQGFGEYINTLHAKARDVGFVEGTPVIDLTGHSPGVIYAIGGRNTAQPWLIGNFPGYDHGGDKVASWSLSKVRCEELADVWLLAEPKGPIPLSASVTRSFGADMTRDYRVAVRHKTVPGLSGFTAVQDQQLLKPIRSHAAAVKACKDTRAQ